jgi:RNase P protein component
MLPNLPCQTNSNLNAIIGRLVEKQQQDLCRNNFIRYLLIAQMRNKSRCGETDSLVVSFEAFLELRDEALEKELSNLRQFSIDDSCHSCIYRSKG